VAQTSVFYNGVRDIEFDVTDKSGLVHTVVIKGSGAGIRGVNGQPLPAVGAYGVTVVDADLWAAIKTAFADHPAFKGGFVKDGESEKAKAKAKEEVSALDNGQGAAKQEEAGKKKTRKK
jgi:hypothetical protein